MKRALVLLILVLCAIEARAEDAPKILSLDEALDTATKNQPQIRQANATTKAAEARARQARASFFPDVSAEAQYQRSTANFTSRPGSIPSTFGGPTPGPSFDSFNYWNFGLSVNQLVYDFGQTIGKAEAAGLNASAQASAEKTTWLDVATTVRTAFFDTRAQKALLAVAQETLVNQQRHLDQIRRFVEVGTRPEIDLAQARTDVANAQVQVITSENSYSTAKARLNQAMGVERDTDYEVADDSIPPVEGEDLGTDVLLEGALAGRPELATLTTQIRAAQVTIGATRGGYWPSLRVSGGLTEAGTDLSDLGWNWSIGALVSWPIFQGGVTRAQVEEAEATLMSLEAQLATLRQEVRLEIEEARLRLRASKATLGAAGEAVESARVRVQLAEGRYQAGVGNVIELGDAQLALTSAQAQKIQAEYNLSSARAQLLKALGLP